MASDKTEKMLVKAVKKKEPVLTVSERQPASHLGGDALRAHASRHPELWRL
jgi:hypothetical protein